MLVAERGAELVLSGFAPLLIVSGGFGKLTRTRFSAPEGLIFAQIARDMGVPEHQILVESQATNTGENIQFTQDLLRQHGLNINSIIAVQKPYMERRALAALEQQWPSVKWQITSPGITFDEAMSAQTGAETISLMVGNTQRLRVYAERGFQKAQDIPNEVWVAFEYLTERDFDTFLISS